MVENFEMNTVTFLRTADATTLAKLVEHLEQGQSADLKNCAKAVKEIAVHKMMDELEGSIHKFKVANSKRYPTHLHIDENTMRACLFLSKKDSANPKIYIALYDEHKDKLLKLIGRKKAVCAASEQGVTA